MDQPQMFHHVRAEVQQKLAVLRSEIVSLRQAGGATPQRLDDLLGMVETLGKVLETVEQPERSPAELKAQREREREAQRVAGAPREDTGRILDDEGRLVEDDGHLVDQNPTEKHPLETQESRDREERRREERRKEGQVDQRQADAGEPGVSRSPDFDA